MNYDVLMQITSKLHIKKLMQLLTSCKYFYKGSQSLSLLENNGMYSAYLHVNNENVLEALSKSDIVFNDCREYLIMTIKRNIPSSYGCIYNTYKLIVFDSIYNADFYNNMRNITCLCNYYSQQVQLSWQRAQSYPDYQFNKFISHYNWNYTNINLYDIYLCMFYVFNRKNYLLRDTLKNMIIEPPQTHQIFVELCQTLMNYINDLRSFTHKIKTLKAVMIIILYKLIGSVSSHMTINENLSNAVINQSIILSQNVDDMKGIPKYLKEFFKKEFATVALKLSHRRQ